MTPTPLASASLLGLRLGLGLGLLATIIARNLGRSGNLAIPRQIRLEIVGADQILDVEKRGSLLTDVDERGLHAR